MDRIRLFGIRAYGSHGADPVERTTRQPFDVDLCVEIDLDTASRNDELTDTLDYARLHERIVEVIERTSFALLERLARELLDVTLRDPRVIRAEVTVAKPAILAGATPSVSLARTNSRRRPE